METIMIPIPAPPEGWVFDAIRKAKFAEYYFHSGEWIYNNSEETVLTYPVAIPIPPKWTPPRAWGELFGDCWLAVDGNGSRYLYQNRPLEGDNDRQAWNPNGGGWLYVNHMFLPEMLPPEYIPWKEAIWKIEAPK